MKASRRDACVLPIPEFSAIRIDYNPLQSSLTNLGSMEQNLVVSRDCLREAPFAPPTSPCGSDHIIKPPPCKSLPKKSWIPPITWFTVM